MWKFIRSVWLNFSNFLWYSVGDGTQVKFWEDIWCWDHPLKEAFLDLYNISRTRMFWSRLCITQIGDYFGTYSFVV